MYLQLLYKLVLANAHIYLIRTYIRRADTCIRVYKSRATVCQSLFLIHSLAYSLAWSHEVLMQTQETTQNTRQLMRNECGAPIIAIWPT